jgi:hypothetical protein
MQAEKTQKYFVYFKAFSGQQWAEISVGSRQDDSRICQK